jgi:hypothetical protein
MLTERSGAAGEVTQKILARGFWARVEGLWKSVGKLGLRSQRALRDRQALC